MPKYAPQSMKPNKETGLFLSNGIRPNNKIAYPSVVVVKTAASR